MTAIPLRLAIDIQSPDGTTHNRWGMDEHDPVDVPSALSFSTTMPGGFEQLSCTLPRKPSVDYSDLAEFSTITVYGAGGEIAWQGRLETTPRTSGDQMSISPGAVGWQAALDDNGSAQMIYVDSDLTQWAPPTTRRQLALAAAGDSPGDVQVSPDPNSSNPALSTSFTGPWSVGGLPSAEAWYDAHGIPIGLITYTWTRGANIDNADTDWTWDILLSTDDIETSTDSLGNLRAAGPASATITAAANNRVWATVQLSYSAAAGVANAIYAIYWNLSVYGTHGLALHGSSPGGVLASDVVQHAITTWAPELKLTDTGGAGTVTPSTYVINQATYPDPTTAGTIINDIIKYELLDWAVWEGQRFWMAPRNMLGRAWRARVGPSGLSETGPQVDRIYNQVIVTYNDVAGIARTVGPTGSGADTIDNSLADSDPANPANAAGLTRCFNLPNIGVSVAAAASQIGQAFLAEQKAISTAGQASIVGIIQDSSGVTWPAWMIRAGDNITFIDAHDPVPRRIVKTSYDDDTKTNQLDLDSPPEGLQALLARLGAADAALGL